MFIERTITKQVEKSLKNRKILFLFGARQVGKTTLIKHLLKTHSGALLNMDVALDRQRVNNAGQLQPDEGVRQLTGADLLVIDEAHRLPDIGRLVKGWYDAEVPVKIILLGSSSATLADIAAAELVGRNEKLWLTPLLFEEVLLTQAWFTSNQPAPVLQRDFTGQIQALLLQRLIFGSYPEAYLTAEPQTYLENLVNDYLLKDIFTNSIVRSPDDVRRLLIELAQEVGQSVSVVQLATRLKLSRQTVQRYLDLLEGIFVIFRLPVYVTNPVTEITKQTRYYFWDTGVKNALQREWTISSERSDTAALWENWVVAEVMKLSRTYRRHEDLFYWRSRHDSTVDLIVKQGSTLHAFDIRFHPRSWRPSLSFQRTYGVAPQLIHPGNILEILM
jgi:predicted AAA+ superfamily ATPase